MTNVTKVLMNAWGLENMNTKRAHHITISFNFLPYDGGIAALSLSQVALHHCRLYSDRSKQVWQSKSLSRVQQLVS